MLNTRSQAIGFEVGQDFVERGIENWSGIGAIGEQFCKKRKLAKQRGQQPDAAVAILNVSGMNDRVQQQTLHVDENMPFLALDQFACIEPVRINTGPPCMGPFLSSGFGAAHLSFLIGFLVRPGVPFLRPDPQYYKAGARRSCQGWPSPQPCGVLRPCQATP
jgi:hypothetical protein